MNQAILLISCPDQRGITAGVTDFVFRNGGNILHADQHIDEQSKTFFMRIAWDTANFATDESETRDQFSAIADKFSMTWSLHWPGRRDRAAIFVSKHLHCLHDLLYRSSSGQLNCDISMIISNHSDAGPYAKQFDIPYYEISISPETKLEQEQQEKKLLQDADVDWIILARYHQILSPQFVQAFENRIINIHHSFLPAFPGGNPYAQAYAKGVKLIGATSHFVSDVLDEGPIIEQDTVRVSHRDELDDFKRKGEDLERVVLSRAVRWAIEKKILVYNRKTVVFD